MDPPIIERLEEDSHISAITPEDQALFSSFFEKNRDSVDYGNSWGYIIEATFFGGFKFFDGGTLIAFTTKAPKKLPFVIVKALGEKRLEKTLQLAEYLRKLSNQKVIIKNLSEREFAFFRERGFSDYRAGDCWNRLYRYDDDTFPEVIVDLKSVARKSGRDYRSLRYHTNRFRRQYSYRLEECSRKEHMEDALKVLKAWEDSFRERYRKEVEIDPLLLHSIDLHRKFMTSRYSGSNGRDHFSEILFINGRPVGFILALKISGSCIGVYSNVSETSYSGLSETFIYETLKKAQSQGFSLANFGGSEFENLMEFRWKFSPISYIQRYHAILYPDAKVV